jgi:hypothetical protein
MPEAIDDFTIQLPHSTDMHGCDLKIYRGLDRLWGMVERYRMTSPLTITVIDNKAQHVRSISGNRDQATGWKLKDGKPPALTGTVEFPVTIRVEDARRSILKMRIQLEATIPNSR